MLHPQSNSTFYCEARFRGRTDLSCMSCMSCMSLNNKVCTMNGVHVACEAMTPLSCALAREQPGGGEPRLAVHSSEQGGIRIRRRA